MKSNTNMLTAEKVFGQVLSGERPLGRGAESNDQMLALGLLYLTKGMEERFAELDSLIRRLARN